MTTGALLFLVAILAGNLGALRFLVEQDRNSQQGDSIAELLVEPLLGLLPVINVALIGSIIYACKWMRSARQPGEAARISILSPALTYFSLHFLLLGLLFGVFMSDAFLSYRWATIEPITDYTRRVWPDDSLRTTDSFPSIAFKATLIAVLCSGPILVLAWIGRMLAIRYAATIPRRRFRMMTGLVSSGFAAVALAIVVLPQPFEHYEDEVGLSFKIIDKDSRQPIRSAFLRLTDPFDPDALPPSALTDAEGRARLVGRFPVKGERNLFRTMGIVSTWGRWLEVSAPGYQTVCLALPEVLTPNIGLEMPVPAKVALAKGKTPKPLFRDLAGSYRRSHGFGGKGIEIGPDGRFAWMTSSCTYLAQEYGYLKRDDEEIVLISVSHPGRETHPEMTLRYRAIPWGDHLYFSSMEQDELQRFCWATLALSDREPFVMMRETPLEKPQVGLPRIPAKVWVRFVLDETNLWNEEGSLRLALRSLLPRNLWGVRDVPPWLISLDQSQVTSGQPEARSLIQGQD